MRTIKGLQNFVENVTREVLRTAKGHNDTRGIGRVLIEEVGELFVEVIDHNSGRTPYAFRPGEELSLDDYAVASPNSVVHTRRYVEALQVAAMAFYIAESTDQNIERFTNDDKLNEIELQMAKVAIAFGEVSRLYRRHRQSEDVMSKLENLMNEVGRLRYTYLVECSRLRR